MRRIRRRERNRGRLCGFRTLVSRCARSPTPPVSTPQHVPLPRPDASRSCRVWGVAGKGGEAEGRRAVQVVRARPEAEASCRQRRQRSPEAALPAERATRPDASRSCRVWGVAGKGGEAEGRRAVQVVRARPEAEASCRQRRQRSPEAALPAERATRPDASRSCRVWGVAGKGGEAEGRRAVQVVRARPEAEASCRQRRQRSPEAALPAERATRPDASRSCRVWGVAGKGGEAEGRRAVQVVRARPEAEASCRQRRQRSPEAALPAERATRPDASRSCRVWGVAGKGGEAEGRRAVQVVRARPEAEASCRQRRQRSPEAALPAERATRPDASRSCRVWGVAGKGGEAEGRRAVQVVRARPEAEASCPQRRQRS